MSSNIEIGHTKETYSPAFYFTFDLQVCHWPSNNKHESKVCTIVYWYMCQVISKPATQLQPSQCLFNLWPLRVTLTLTVKKCMLCTTHCMLIEKHCYVFMFIKTKILLLKKRSKPNFYGNLGYWTLTASGVEIFFTSTS